MCAPYAVNINTFGAICHDHSNSHTTAAHNAGWPENTDRKRVYHKFQWDGEGEFDLAKACHDDTRVEDLNDAQIAAAKKIYAAVKCALAGNMSLFEPGGVFYGPNWIDLYARALLQHGGVTDVTLPEGLQSIGEWAFYGCTSLTSVTLPEGLQSIGRGAFYGCTSLTSVTLPEGLQSIGEWTFRGCTSLRSVTLPEGLKSIGSEAFGGCTSLTSVTLPEGLQSIGYGAFEGCKSLTSVTLPEGLKSIERGAFHGCRNLDAASRDAIAKINPYAF